MKNKSMLFRLFAGLMSICLLTGNVAAVAPSLNYKLEGSNLTLTYTGTLYQSSDAVHWSEVGSASSPYKVKITSKKLFFCAKGEYGGAEGQNFTILLADNVSLDMVWCPAGTFTMGSPEGELGRLDDLDEELPHSVTLSHDFWIGKYEVTQVQYNAIMGMNSSEFDGANLPVEMVSWDDAKEFCAKLTAREKTAGRLPSGYEYTLPTEAQWEYACRAGTTTALNSGKNLTSTSECPNMDEVGWYGYNSDDTTHPVGQKKPNNWGIYDMHGNVWELCLDWYSGWEGLFRVMRGGSWYYDADFCRSAVRLSKHPSECDDDIGFRVALSFCDTEQPTEQEENFTIPLSGTVNLDMVWCPAGTFMMGSPEGERGRCSNEVQHGVTISRGFWIGKYEVTQGQYEALMGNNPSYWKATNHPVECVTWYEAMEFCQKLTQIEKSTGRLPVGYEYTLPTEAQWEYACRAGTTTALNSGKNLSGMYECPEMDEVGWYWYNGGEENYYNGSIWTHPVGQKKSNAWGIYDMHGNVWEWCKDWFGNYPSSSVADPTGPSIGWIRVLRGGGWYPPDGASFCRSAKRGNCEPDGRYFSYGFRVALTPVQ